MAMVDFNAAIRDLISSIMLNAHAELEVKDKHYKWYQKVKRGGIATVDAGLKVGSGVAAGVGGIKVATGIPAIAAIGGIGSTFTPIGWAIKPWVAAFEVYGIMGKLEELETFSNPKVAASKSAVLYPCTCHLRKKAIETDWTPDKTKLKFRYVQRDATTYPSCTQIEAYYRHQMDLKAMKVAVMATVVGAPFYIVGTMGNFVMRAIKGTRSVERTHMAKSLIINALPYWDPSRRLPGTELMIVEDGCRRAQAMVALFCNELKNLSAPADNPDKYPTSLKVLLHPDGCQPIMAAFNR
jgi:hypothetical protein